MEESDDTAVRRTRSAIAKSAKVTPAKPIRQKPGPLSKKKKKVIEIEVSDDEDENEKKKEIDSSEEKTEVEEKSEEKSEENPEEKVEVNGSENKEAESTEVILNDIVMLEDDSEKKNEAETKMEVDEVTNTNDSKSEESKPDSESEKVDSSLEKDSKTEEKETNEKSPEKKTETNEDSNGVDESVTDDEPLKKKKKLNEEANKEKTLDETEKLPEIKDKEEKEEKTEIKEKADNVELKLDEEETKPDTEETKPDTEETKPDKEETKPDEEETKPEKEETKPDDEETKSNEKEVTEEKKNESEEKDDKQKADPDTENISEDELPSVQAVKVPEAEEVSDEELPGPKRAELPADTEVVSEDELPTVKNDTKKESGKRKRNETDYDPGSPTSENETSSKKQSVDTSAEKEKEEKPKPKKLPELDKYWKAVNDDPTDFTGWTYLLQYVDQENDMEAAREAYDAFLSHYPYCYGYWRKYADYEKRKGNKKKCEEVFERGLKAIPLSVDLWIHYLTYVKATRAEDEDFIRAQFERALLACGLEFRSDRLWDSYIKWENEGKRLQKVTAIYDRLMTTPTQGYTSHFENFQEHVSANAPNKILDVDEFLALRKEVKQQLKHDISDAPPADSDAPPGDEEQSKPVNSDEETKAIRERIISIRRKVHKNTVNAVTARWNYEEGIKRPYFHVKPLERCQLKNWQDYLDYETEQGDKVRIIVLFERCLIACALYEEFWLKFVHYLENLKDAELTSKIRDVYERACTIHHLKKPNLHLQWAMFEEGIDNINRAAEILVNLEKSVPNVLQIAYRRINLERRRGDHEKCAELYEHYISSSKNKIISSSIAIKYSRFTYVIVKDINKAQEILKSAIAKDPHNPRLYLQLIDLTLQKENVTEEEVIQVMNLFLEKENTDPEQKILFSQRKLEYLEDFGTSIKAVQEAHDQHQKILKLNKENLKKKEIKSDPPAASKSKEIKTTPPSSVSNSYNSGTYGPSNQPPYPAYSGSQQGTNYYPQYNQNDQYQYQNWQYTQGGYGGYNQWGGYGGGYGY